MRDDDRRTRQLLWAAVALVVVGLLAFVVDGADRPADPELDAGAPVADLPAPGDPSRTPLEGFDEVAVHVRPEGADSWLGWCLLAARTAAQRGRGLMEVTDLQGYSGMAFVYDEDVQNAFYMRDTPTPLSIAWVGADGRVVSTADMAPCEDREGCPTYPPAGPYRYAIEVFQGDLPELGITPAATVEVGGACAPRS